MALKVTRLELSQLDDGRQKLLIEFEGRRPVTMEWYGQLTADFFPPRKDRPGVVYDLLMTPRAASNPVLGEHWARLTVDPPRQPDLDLPIEP